MKNSVSIIAHPETGKMFTPTADADWEKCQLHSEEIVVQNGVFTLQSRTCFPLFHVKVTKLLKNLKNGDTFPIPGRILRRVTLTPQYTNKDGSPQEKVINPKTDEEMPYYSTYFFSTLAGETDYDERVMSKVTVEATAEEIPADQVV